MLKGRGRILFLLWALGGLAWLPTAVHAEQSSHHASRGKPPPVSARNGSRFPRLRP